MEINVNKLVEKITISAEGFPADGKLTFAQVGDLKRQLSCAMLDAVKEVQGVGKITADFMVKEITIK